MATCCVRIVDSCCVRADVMNVTGTSSLRFGRVIFHIACPPGGIQSTRARIQSTKQHKHQTTCVGYPKHQSTYPKHQTTRLVWSKAPNNKAPVQSHFGFQSPKQRAHIHQTPTPPPHTHTLARARTRIHILRVCFCVCVPLPLVSHSLYRCSCPRSLSQLSTTPS